MVNLYSSSIPFFRLEKEILDRYLDVVLKGNKDGLKVSLGMFFSFASACVSNVACVLLNSAELLFLYSHVLCCDGDQKLRLRIDDPPHRKHMVYLGGAVLAGIMKV